MANDISSLLNFMNAGQLYAGKGRLVNNSLASKQSTNASNTVQQEDKNFNVNLSNEGLAALQNQTQADDINTGIFTNKELSPKAQAYLDKLREQYGDYDFIIADDVDDPQTLTANSTKKYSVILSSDELEKMADDEEYASSMLGKVEDAVKMADNIIEKADLGGKAQISQLTISFDNDGNTKLFATLEKLSESQQQRLDAAKEKSAEEAKQTEKPEEEKSNSFTINADTEEDFLEQLKQINWDEMFEFNSQVNDLVQ